MHKLQHWAHLHAVCSCIVLTCSHHIPHGSSRSHLSSIVIPSMDMRIVVWVFLFLPAFYFLLYLCFLLFFMTDGDSVTMNTLCNSDNGTFVTLDDYLPNTLDATVRDSNVLMTTAVDRCEVNEGVGTEMQTPRRLILTWTQIDPDSRRKVGTCQDDDQRGASTRSCNRGPPDLDMKTVCPPQALSQNMTPLGREVMPRVWTSEQSGQWGGWPICGWEQSKQAQSATRRRQRAEGRIGVGATSRVITRTTGIGRRPFGAWHRGDTSSAAWSREAPSPSAREVWSCSRTIRIGRRFVFAVCAIVEKGAPGGPSGMTADHFQPILESGRDAAPLAAASLAEGIRMGRITGLSKPDGGVRGIVVGDILRQLVARTILTNHGRGGGGHSTPQVRIEHKGWLRVRGAPSCRPAPTRMKTPPLCQSTELVLATPFPEWGQDSPPFLKQFYSSPSTCVWEATCTQQEVTQGEGDEEVDPLMPMLFCLGQQKEQSRVDSELAKSCSHSWTTSSWSANRNSGWGVHYGKTQVWNRSGSTPQWRGRDAVWKGQADSKASECWECPSVGSMLWTIWLRRQKTKSWSNGFRWCKICNQRGCCWTIVQSNFLVEVSETPVDCWIFRRPVVCFSQLVGIASVSIGVRQSITVPLSLGGMGLRSARRARESAHWSSWADSLPMIRNRHATVATMLIQGLNVRDTRTFSAVGACSDRLQSVGFHPPSWEDLAKGEQQPEEDVESQGDRNIPSGWQKFSTRMVEQASISWSCVVETARWRQCRSLRSQQIGRESCSTSLQKRWRESQPTSWSETWTFRDSWRCQVGNRGWRTQHVQRVAVWPLTQLLRRDGTGRPGAATRRYVFAEGQGTHTKNWQGKRRDVEMVRETTVFDNVGPCREKAARAWLTRWKGILACTAARAFVVSLLEKRPFPGWLLLNVFCAKKK